MLISKIIEIKLSPRNVNHYREKGYKIPTKYSDKSHKEVLDTNTSILVSVYDMPKNSHIKIKYRCDNCGKEFETRYVDWLNRKYVNNGDLCLSCAVKIKLPIAMQEKYGESNCAHVQSVINKKKQTDLEIYGNEYHIASKKVRDKIEQNNVKKYGSKNPMQNKEIQRKTRETNIKKYGGPYPMYSENVRNKYIETCYERYGVKNSYQVLEFQEKAKNTLLKNGNIPCSKPEGKMCEILKELFSEENCIPSYVEGKFVLDCLVEIKGIKIDFEYDGWFWHKNRQEQDRKRNGVLMRLGYRIIRIKAGKNDILPDKKQIMNAVDYIINQGHHLTIIDMTSKKNI